MSNSIPLPYWYAPPTHPPRDSATHPNHQPPAGAIVHTCPECGGVIDRCARCELGKPLPGEQESLDRCLDMMREVQG